MTEVVNEWTLLCVPWQFMNTLMDGLTMEPWFNRPSVITGRPWYIFQRLQTFAGMIFEELLNAATGRHETICVTQLPWFMLHIAGASKLSHLIQLPHWHA